jgi:hypothetical protein
MAGFQLAVSRVGLLVVLLCMACSDSNDPAHVPPPGIYRLVGYLPAGNRTWDTIELGQYYPDSVRYVLSDPDFAPAADNQFREPVGPGEWGFTFTVLDQRAPGYIRWTIKRHDERYLCSKLILMSSSEGPYDCTFRLVTLGAQ